MTSKMAKFELRVKYIFFFLLLAIFLTFVFHFSLTGSFFSSQDMGISYNKTCVTNVGEEIIRGNSLSGFIEDGESVRVLFGYYDCNTPNRNDLIIYSHSGREDPLIKIVRGVPGDFLGFLETDNGWNILINDKILRNSEGNLYAINKQRYKMLSLYEGVIPDGAYLILGNLVTGTLDSTQYGLVSVASIIGKAEKIIPD